MVNPHHPQPLPERIRHQFDRFINYVEIAGLVLIGLATTVAMAQETWKVLSSGHVTLSDLLLMFLYLEVLAMDGRYLRLGQLPVRFPLYIAMASLARELILRFDDASNAHMLVVTFGIVLLAVGILILRFGQNRFPASDDEGREQLHARRSGEIPPVPRGPVITAEGHAAAEPAATTSGTSAMMPGTVAAHAGD